MADRILVDLADVMPYIQPWENVPRGEITLTGATPVIVLCPQVTDTSLIFLSITVPGGTTGVAWVADRIPGTRFRVVSNLLHTSKVAWMLVPPLA